MTYSLYAAFLVASTVLSGLLILLLFRYRNNSVAQTMFLLAANSLGINLALLISIYSPDEQTFRFWHGNVRLFLNSLIAPAGFLFVSTFLEGKSGKLKWLIFASPLLTLFISLTNDWHGWLFSSYEMKIVDGFHIRDNWTSGWWFHFYAVWSSLVSFGLVYLLFGWIGRTRKLPRWRGILVVSTVFLVTISILLDTFGLNFAEGVLNLPFGLGLMILFLALGVWYLDLFDILPIARETLTRYISDGFFVLDTNNIVLDANPAASQMTGLPVRQMLGKSMLDLIERPERRETAERILSGEFHGVIPLVVEGVAHFYDVMVTNIFVEKHALVAKLIVLRDVSELKRLQDEENKRIAIEERQRLARDLHDAVSQTLFSARLTSEMLLRQKNTLAPETLWERVAHFDGLVRSALGEMRILLLELRPESLLKADLPALISHLADAVSARTEALIQVDITGKQSPPVDVKIAFYRIAQEALNNVVKHSRSKNVKIRVVSAANSLYLQVEDDGIGLGVDTVKGTKMGLAIMRERATDVGARLEIVSQIGKGTKITCSWQDVMEMIE